MQIFRVEKRRSMFLAGALNLAVAFFIILIGIIGIGLHNWLAGLIAMAMGLSVGYHGWAYGIRAPYEIRAAMDGSLVFRRPLGTTRVAMRDIRRIEGVMKRDYDRNPE